MRFGTSYFVSRHAAERYYSAYEDDAPRAVARKLAAGEIHIGKPSLKPGQRLSVIPGEGRYQIEETPRDLVAEIKAKAPGFYTERDGGDWYCVTPDHSDRVGEDFANRDDARRLILWLAGDDMPKGWTITGRNDLFCSLDCGQGYDATIWTREACRLFPAREGELRP